MGLPFAQRLNGMPALIAPPLAPPTTQPITDGTFIFPLIQSKIPSKQDAETLQPPLESSSLLLSSFQHQAQCLQATHKTIQQFYQHLKAEQLDRRTLQITVLQLQNDFAKLRYLLFSSVETTLISETSVSNSGIIPPTTVNPNPNPQPTSILLPIPSADDPSVRRSTPVGAVGPPRAKTNNSANADMQPTPNTQEAPTTTVQNLTSRISKLEKLFADEKATYKSITAGIHSQNFFLYDKIRQLEPGNPDAIIWKIPSAKFVFDSAKVARPSSDPLIEQATSFSSPIFGTHPHGYNFFVNFFT